MKNIYFKSSIFITSKWLIIIIVILIGSANLSNGQVRVPFTQRTSSYSTTKKIYSIKGDFTMIGNTNLTLENYGENTQNGNNNMVYVDVDGDANTLNSSSATLSLSTENGAIPSCSNIIYAGLYWTGRTTDNSPSNNTFNVSKDVPGMVPYTKTSSIPHNQSISNTGYTMTVKSSGNIPSYTFTGGAGDPVVVFDFLNSSPYIQYKVNGGAIQVPANQVVKTNGKTRTVTFNPVTIYSLSGSVTITVDQFVRDTRSRNQSQYQSSSYARVKVDGLIPGTITINKTYNKHTVLFKGPGQSYTQVAASTNPSAIYFPDSSDGYMYSAYAEVTDLVKSGGIGEYFVADIALKEGDGGGTGYYGGWGLIVVYENSKMKNRDVTIFDGHAYVATPGNSQDVHFDLPVSGFNAVQAGAVNMKLGLMAGEGDAGITGDYFSIQKHSDASWLPLNHSLNTTNNYFNSSILIGGTRNPNLKNNTGLDISMFNIPNINNSVITNGQTSTTFRYGTTKDSYIIFAIAMAVDAYVPEPELINSVQTIGGVSVSGPLSALPGQEVVYKVEIRNKGTEAINNAKIIIPIPYTASFASGSLSSTVNFTPPPTPNALTFNSSLGATGSIVWDFGTLPLPASPGTLLATLTYKLKVTEDCSTLSNTNCPPKVEVNGKTSGTGAVTTTNFDNISFIQGFKDQTCAGEPITDPVTVEINSDDYVAGHCQNTPTERTFVYCNVGGSIPLSDVSGYFPVGSRYYDQYPVTGSSTEYTANNPFPAAVGTTTYYAVPPGTSDCYFQFKINVTSIVSAPTVSNIEYCKAATAQPLTAVKSDNSYSLYFYDSQTSTNPETSITPSTDVEGSKTYWVAEGASNACISPNKVPITVKINPLPICTITGSNGPLCPSSIGNSYTAPAGMTSYSWSISGNGTISGSTSLQNASMTTGTGNNQTSTLSLTITNSNGCSSTDTKIVNVADNTAPVTPVLADVTGECSATATAPTTTDNCSGTITGTTTDPLTYNTQGTHVIHWSFNDGHGNTSTANQNLVIHDVTAPVLTGTWPSNQTGLNLCQSASPAGPTDATIASLFNDACNDGVTVTHTLISTGDNCNWSNVYLYSIKDAVGNEVLHNYTISGGDQTAPTFTAPADITVFKDAVCNYSSETGSPTNIIDNCSSISDITITHTDGNCFGSDSGGNVNAGNGLTVNFTVNGFAGQPASAINNVALSFSTNKGIGHAEITLVAPSGQAIVLVGPYCSSCTNGGGTYAPVFYGSGYTQWNNESNPSGSGNYIPYGGTSTNSIPGVTGFVSSFSGFTGSMNGTWKIYARKEGSGSGSFEFNSVCLSPGCANDQVIVRHWTVTDACGNASTADQVISIHDNTAPVIAALPAPTTIDCSTTPVFAIATATDNCGRVTLTFVDNRVDGNCAGSFSVTRTWTATDACGNSSSASQIINVQDVTKPVISDLPAPSTIIYPSTPDFAVATATDNCGGDVTLTFVDNRVDGACAGSYSITRTWTATDACGNTSEKIAQTISVIDDIAPEITTPTGSLDAEILCSDLEEIANALTKVPVATDNSRTIPTIHLISDFKTPKPGHANAYYRTRTWNFEDRCGNISKDFVQIISVVDYVDPVITTPAGSLDRELECSDSEGLAAALALAPVATDNCAAVTFIHLLSDTTTPTPGLSGYSRVRSWNFDDGCQRISTDFVQTITVRDTEKPTITAPVAVSVSADAGKCTATGITLGTPVTSDNCSVASVTNDAVEPFAIGNTTVTWTVTDGSGNTQTAIQTINVQDITAPVIDELPAPSTIDCPGAPSFAQATAIDACGSTFTLTFADVTTPGAWAGSYSITRTWTAKDSYGNVSSKSQVITVQDKSAPVLSRVPADVTMECDSIVYIAPSVNLVVNGDFSNATPPFAFSNGYTYKKDIAGINNELQPEGLYAVGPDAHTYHTNFWGPGHGGTGDNFMIVNGYPGSPQPIVWQETLTGLQVGTVYYFSARARSLNNVGNYANLKFNINGSQIGLPTGPLPAGPADNNGPFTWKQFYGNWTADSETAVLSIVDLTTDANGNDFGLDDISFGTDVTASDNCDPNPKVTFAEVRTQGNCPKSYTLTRTWTATDACGNSSSKTQTIKVQDTQAPVLSMAPANVTVECNAIPQAATLTATDNCDSSPKVTFVEVRTDGNCAGNYILNRTWTAIDACGNASSKSQIITVQDKTAPVLSEAPANITVECNAIPQAATLTATDNCDASPEVTFSEVRTDGNCAGNYILTRTWTATDACGNASSKSQVIIVQDKTAPVLSGQGTNATINCPATPSFTAPTASDNCDVTAKITFTDKTLPGASAAIYTITRTWIATDACGNVSAPVSQSITVTDVTAPVLSGVPADAAASCDNIPVAATPTATDKCDANPLITLNEVSTQLATGIGHYNYTITRTWTATDVAGNHISQTQVITVTDTSKPTITVPANVLVSSDTGKCTASGVALGTPVTADNCSVPNVTNDAPATYPLGNTTVTWTVTDVSGNTQTATQVVTVIDNQKPAIKAPAALSVNSDEGKCTASGVALGTPVTSDNCSVASVTNNALVTYPPGNTTVIWTVTDASGNTQTATQVVTVTDNQKPAITAPAALSVNSDEGKCTASGVALGTPVTFDNCSVATVTNNAPASYPLGNTTVTWTVTDASGNTQTATQVVSVTDNQKPAITAPAALSINSDEGKCTASGVALGTPVTSDNCSVASVTNDAHEPFVTGNTTVTWTITDASGNTQTAIQVVTVNDNQKPAIIAPGAISVGTDAGKSSASGVALGTPVTSDNCSVASVTNDAPATYPLGITTVTWTVTDGSGNTQTATQVVTVTDPQKPIFIHCLSGSNQTVNTDTGSITYVNKNNNWNPVATDNDMVISLVYNFSGATTGSGTSLNNVTFNMGVTTVTWSATDKSGNVSNCIYNVTVVDNEKPAFITCMVGTDILLKSATSLPNHGVMIIGTDMNATASDNDRLLSLTYTLSGATSGSGTSLNNVMLNVGETTVTWTAVDNSGNTSICQFKITVLDSNLPPTAVDDQFTVKAGTQLTGDVSLNDSDLTEPINMLNVTLIDPGKHGKLSVNQNGTFTYMPDPEFVGTDHFIYEICKTSNSSLCSKANVTINVERNSDCSIFVPNGFSPDGDGINDLFKIKCISNYPNALLRIFTRSGINVYERKHYGNIDYWGSETDAWWDGRTFNKWNIGGNKVASGTYIYILELEEGNKDKVLTGSVFLSK